MHEAREINLFVYILERPLKPGCSNRFLLNLRYDAVIYIYIYIESRNQMYINYGMTIYIYRNSSLVD